MTSMLERCATAYATLCRDIKLDFQSYLPEQSGVYGACLDSSVEYLRNQSRARGLHVWLVDLPKLGKAIDRMMTTGIHLSDSTIGVPNIFSQRWYEIEDNDCFLGIILADLYAMRESITSRWDGEPTDIQKLGLRSEAILLARLFGSIRQLCYVFKKLDVPCPDQAITKAVAEFRDLDSELREPTMDWSSENWQYEAFRVSFSDLEVSSEVTDELELFQLVCDWFHGLSCHETRGCDGGDA
jgi:hypothetical protein